MLNDTCMSHRGSITYTMYMYFSIKLLGLTVTLQIHELKSVVHVQYHAKADSVDSKLDPRSYRVSRIEVRVSRNSKNFSRISMTGFEETINFSNFKQ